MPDTGAPRRSAAAQPHTAAPPPSAPGDAGTVAPGDTTPADATGTGDAGTADATGTAHGTPADATGTAHATPADRALDVLARRFGGDRAQALDHLGRLARRHGAELAEAATAVLTAGTATGGGSPAPLTPALPTAAAEPAASPAPGVEDDPAVLFESTHYLAGPTGQRRRTGRRAWPGPGAPVTVPPLDAVAALLRDRLAGPLGPVAVGLLAVEMDGSLQVVGAAGVPAAVAAAWERLPARLDTPPGYAARTARACWLPDLSAARRFLLVGEPEPVWPSRAVLPVRVAGRVVMVVVVLCESARCFDRPTRRAVRTRVARLADRMVDLLRWHPHPARWVVDAQAILDMLPGAVAVIAPVRDAGGTVVDYEYLAVSPEAVDVGGRRGRDLVGVSLRGLYPTVVGTELWHAYRQVLETGRPREVGPFTYTEVAEGIAAEAVYTVRAHRFGSALLVSWVHHDEQRRYAARLAQYERLGNLGWAEWDLTTDAVFWSDQLFEIFERETMTGPATLDEVGAYVHEDDRAKVGRQIRSLLGEGRPMDVVFRIRVPSGMRHVRAICEVSTDPTGRPLRSFGIVQDVTAAEEVRRDRARLADVERELIERRRDLQTEHRLVAALQQVILPLPAGAVELPGLRVAVRFQPAEELARVGGDWYDVVRLPSGGTLLVVGDVAGHGITAAAAMVRLRHALTALAVTTTDPARLLTLLNQVTCDDATEPTATAVVARYDPATSTLTWAQAGHPPPLLLSGGTVRAVERPAGMILGARREAVYGRAALTLEPGDTLLLYTDGLVEHRDAVAGDWLAPVSAELAVLADQPVDRLVAGLRPANPGDDTCLLALRPGP
jgi:PAS domain-containing protein